MGPAHFARVMAGADGPALDEAALAISGTLQGGLDEIEWLAALDVLAGDCPTPTPDGVSRYLFGDLGFAGAAPEDYYDWRNSCLDLVIERRVGIPISLSVLMIEVARRIGVALHAVGMPGHVIVGVDGGGDRWFDPFHHGRQLDRDGVIELFEQVTGGRAAWDDRFLVPTPDREIVVRMLNNLKALFSARGDRVRLAHVMQLRAALPELAAMEADEIANAASVFN